MKPYILSGSTWWLTYPEKDDFDGVFDTLQKKCPLKKTCKKYVYFDCGFAMKKPKCLLEAAK